MLPVLPSMQTPEAGGVLSALAFAPPGAQLPGLPTTSPADLLASRAFWAKAALPGVEQPVGGLMYSLSKFLNTRGDSDVSFATPDDGTDYTTPIQQLLDKCAADGAGIYWDGKYAVSDILELPSHTFIRAKPGCGVIRKTSTRRPILRNADWSRTSYANANIHLENLTVNGNSYGLTDGTSKIDSGTEYGAYNGLVFLIDVWLSGLDGLVIKGCSFFNSRNYAVAMDYLKYFQILNNRIDQGDAFSEANHDGFHFWGDISNGVIHGNIVRAGDDAYAFNADEPEAVEPTAIYSHGPITDVLMVDNVLDNGSRGGTYGKQGVRIMSVTSLIDRLVVRGLRGVTTNYIMGVDNFPDSIFGPGNFGNIVIEDIDVSCPIESAFGPQIGPCYAEFNGVFRSLTLRNWNRPEGTNYLTDTFHFGTGFDAKTLTIEDLTWTESVQESPTQIRFEGNADLVRLVGAVAGRPAEVNGGGVVVLLDTDSPLKGIGRLETVGCDLRHKGAAVSHASGYLGELWADGGRQECTPLGWYSGASGTVLGRYGAGPGMNVVHLVDPNSAGTILSKYGPGFDGSGDTTGARYVTGKTSALFVYNGNKLTFQDTACTTAATADGATVKAWVDAMSRGRVCTETTTNPTLKTGLFGGAAQKGIRFDGSNDILNWPDDVFFGNPLTVVILCIPRSTAAGVCQFVSILGPASNGWGIGRDADKARFAVVRQSVGAEFVICLGSAGTLVTGTATFLAGTYDVATGETKLYQAATGAATFTLLDTEDLSGFGVMSLYQAVGAFGGNRATLTEMGQVDIGWVGLYDFCASATQLDAELAIAKAEMGY